MEQELEIKITNDIAESIYPWRLHPVYNVPFCDSACHICAPYIRHLGLAYAGLSDDPNPSSPLDEKENEEESNDSFDDEDDVQTPQIGWEPPQGTAEALIAEESDDEENENIDINLRTNMRTTFMLQSAHGRAETSGYFDTDPAALGRAQKKLADQLDEISKAKKKKNEVRAKIQAVVHELDSIAITRQHLASKLQSLDPSSRRQKNRTLASTNEATNHPRSPNPSNSSTTAMDTEETEAWLSDIIRVSISDIAVRQSIPSNQRVAGGKMPAANASAEEFATWMQTLRRTDIRGVPTSAPQWIIDLRDVRGHQVIATLVPRTRGIKSKIVRQRRRTCFFAVLRILVVPGEYAAIVKRLSLIIASGPLSAIDFDPSPDQSQDITTVHSLAASGLEIVTADDCWQFCWKFVEAEIRCFTYNWQTDGYSYCN
ncbi:hypothetical protein DFH06DRAFT_1140714 [Mycena polygramma]|nr:hypothetical protein DFH06DRAFT_1140714 [Mycena polygramma]